MTTARAFGQRRLRREVDRDELRFGRARPSAKYSYSSPGLMSSSDGMATSEITASSRRRTLPTVSPVFARGTAATASEDVSSASVRLASIAHPVMKERAVVTIVIAPSARIVGMGFLSVGGRLGPRMWEERAASVPRWDGNESEGLSGVDRTGRSVRSRSDPPWRARGRRKNSNPFGRVTQYVAGHARRLAASTGCRRSACRPRGVGWGVAWLAAHALGCGNASRRAPAQEVPIERSSSPVLVVDGGDAYDGDGEETSSDGESAPEPVVIPTPVELPVQVDASSMRLDGGVATRCPVKSAAPPDVDVRPETPRAVKVEGRETLEGLRFEVSNRLGLPRNVGWWRSTGSRPPRRGLRSGARRLLTVKNAFFEGGFFGPRGRASSRPTPPGRSSWARARVRAAQAGREVHLRVDERPVCFETRISESRNGALRAPTTPDRPPSRG